MVFDLPHCLPVIDSLGANRTLVELQGSNRVRPALELARPVAPHLSDFGAAARRANRDSQCTHGLSNGLLGRDQRIVIVAHPVLAYFGLCPQRHRRTPKPEEFEEEKRRFRGVDATPVAAAGPASQPRRVHWRRSLEAVHGPNPLEDGP
jgi:hypothetical protein